MAAFESGEFTWLFGIEDTCVYPADPDAATLDEHELTGHSDSWREDLILAKELGATALRYGASWPLVHTAPETFDWSVLDEVIPFAVTELGLTIVADLVHYGTPRWLPGSFADPGYPEAIARFAGEFAARYRGLVSHFTPLNEPVTTASFCGLRGIWPPHLTGWEGWVAVAVPMALGMARAIESIRRAHPAAVIVHVEAATSVETSDDALQGHAELLRGVGWLPTDLLMGRVDAEHPLRAWLVGNGAREVDLDWLEQHGETPDLMGVNYYPDLTPRRLATVDDSVAQVSYDRWTDGLHEVLRAFSDRYRLPLVVTESSIEGGDELRERWLREAASAIRQLRVEGLDIRGFTWWPLFDFVDWSWAAGGSNVEEFVVARVTPDGSTTIAPAPPLGVPSDGKDPFLRRMGLVRLEERPGGRLDRVVTPAARAFEEVTRERL